MIIDFPDTFEKFAPALVRSGKWSASKTLMTEAMRNADELKKVGDAADGLRGTAASAAGGPAGKAFAAYWKSHVKGAKRTRASKARRGRVGRRVPRSGQGVLGSAGEDQEQPARGLGPPGAKVTFLTLGRAVRLLAGREIDYEGRSSPIDFDARGDIGSAVFEIWRYDGGGKISTLKTITFRG